MDPAAPLAPRLSHECNTLGPLIGKLADRLENLRPDWDGCELIP